MSYATASKAATKLETALKAMQARQQKAEDALAALRARLTTGEEQHRAAVVAGAESDPAGLIMLRATIAQAELDLGAITEATHQAARELVRAEDQAGDELRAEWGVVAERARAELIKAVIPLAARAWKAQSNAGTYSSFAAFWDWLRRDVEGVEFDNVAPAVSLPEVAPQSSLIGAATRHRCRDELRAEAE